MLTDREERSVLDSGGRHVEYRDLASRGTTCHPTPTECEILLNGFNLSQLILEQNLDAVLKEIIKQVEAVSPGVVVVDSFRSVVRKASGPTNEMELQGFVQQLALHLTSWQATTFLIGEYADAEVRATIRCSRWRMAFSGFTRRRSEIPSYESFRS